VRDKPLKSFYAVGHAKKQNPLSPADGGRTNGFIGDDRPAAGQPGRHQKDGSNLDRKGVNPEWRLDKVTIFCGICCGAASLSSGGGGDLTFGKAWGDA